MNWSGFFILVTFPGTSNCGELTKRLLAIPTGWPLYRLQVGSILCDSPTASRRDRSVGWFREVVVTIIINPIVIYLFLPSFLVLLIFFSSLLASPWRFAATLLWTMHIFPIHFRSLWPWRGFCCGAGSRKLKNGTIPFDCTFMILLLILILFPSCWAGAGECKGGQQMNWVVFRFYLCTLERLKIYAKINMARSLR